MENNVLAKMQVFDLQQVDYDDGYANGTANGLVDAAFKKIRKNSTCFLVWRIENMNVVALSRDQYGTFYDADSYIIFAASQYGQASGTDAVTREIRTGSLEYHIHFWLGSSTTPDKSGVAAYKTVELDAYLGGYATQHRETQGNESARFRSYFKNGFRILKGGLPSGLNEVIKSFEPKLYKIKGKRSPVVIQQEAVSWKNFNSGDVLIVLTPTIIFIWVGRAANGIEKLHATKTAIEFKTENNISNIVFVDDGYEQTLTDDEKAEFQKYLPLNKRHVLPAEATGDAETENHFRNNIKLYRCSDNSGKYRVTELKSGPLLQADLDSDDVFVLDHGLFGIWVWVGKRASDKERTEAMRNARGFVKKKKYPNETHVTRVVDGAEPYEFKMLFLSWKDKDEAKVKTTNNNKSSKIAITKFDASLMHERPSLAAETQLLDDGSGTTRVWRIKNSEAVEISKDRFGIFFSGDCHIIWYSYQNHGQKHIIYSWFGLSATQEEMASAALKVIEINNELGGTAIQVRVIQGREPSQLLQIFKGKLLTFKGKGTEYDESGRNAKSPTNYLLQVYGSMTYSSKATQVTCKASSLNSNSCFVLRKGKRYYVWSGVYSTGDQREMAKHFTGKDFELILEGKETQEFWEIIGGKENYTVTKMVRDDDGEAKIPRLFHCSTASGAFKVLEVFNFTQADLVPEDVMLLDVNDVMFIWIGKLSTGEERKQSFETALKYLKTDPAGKDVNIPIVQIKQGGEPPVFTGFFGAWDSSWWTEYKSFVEMREQIEGSTKNTMKKPMVNCNAPDDDFDKYDKYPISILKEPTEKLPNKVDPLKKELHLTHDDFVFLFKMKYYEFNVLPRWKQQEMKKKVGLF